MFQPFSLTMQQALEGDSVSLLYFLEIDMLPTVRVHSGLGDITYNGEIYRGMGDLGSISDLSQTADLQSQKVTISLSGLNSELIDMAFAEKYVGKDVRIYLAAMASDGKAVEAFDLLYSGFVTEPTLIFGETNAISLNVSSKMERWANGLSHRYSDENHAEREGGDRFFRYLAATSTMDIRWGNTQTSERFRY